MVPILAGKFGTYQCTVNISNKTEYIDKMDNVLTNTKINQP